MHRSLRQIGAYLYPVFANCSLLMRHLFSLIAPPFVVLVEIGLAAPAVLLPLRAMPAVEQNDFVHTPFACTRLDVDEDVERVAAIDPQGLLLTQEEYIIDRLEAELPVYALEHNALAYRVIHARAFGEPQTGFDRADSDI